MNRSRTDAYFDLDRQRETHAQFTIMVLVDYLPAFLGLSSENAARRIAVQWSEKGKRRQGVFIPRRDSSSWLNSLLGRRLFPGEHHHAVFEVSEEGERLQVKMESDDQETNIFIEARKASGVSPDLIEGAKQAYKGPSPFPQRRSAKQL